MGVLLALGAALAYGLSDFIGGLASRRTSAWSVAFVAAVGSLRRRGRPGRGRARRRDRHRPGLGGPGRHRQRHGWRLPLPRASRPVGWAWSPRSRPWAPRSCRWSWRWPPASGPRRSVWVGIAAAVPGIWLVSREPDSDGGLADGLVDGVLAGAGFGLLFAAMGQVPEEAGWWPTALAQAVALVAVAVTAYRAARRLGAAAPLRPVGPAGRAARHRRRGLLPARHPDRAAHDRRGGHLALPGGHDPARGHRAARAHPRRAGRRPGVLRGRGRRSVAAG